MNSFEKEVFEIIDALIEKYKKTVLPIEFFIVLQGALCAHAFGFKGISNEIKNFLTEIIDKSCELSIKLDEEDAKKVGETPSN